MYCGCVACAGKRAEGGAAMSIKLQEPHVISAVWNRRHLLDLEDLSKAEIETILKRTEELREFSVLRKKKEAARRRKALLKSSR